MNGEEITIRSIQHYMYCPHRWGLVEINRSWAENMYVTKANLMHERVHDPDSHYTSRGKKVFTSVPVYNDLEEYDLYGVTDCLEFTEDGDGVAVEGLKGTYKVCVVEYKPTEARNGRHRPEDVMQVFAQKICVDHVFGCDCETVIYYADVKKRREISFKESYSEYDVELKRLLSEMRTYLKEGRVPPIRKGQKCSGCSMKDLCMPSLKKIKGFESYLEKEFI